ncbi:unnamed protein product [Pylaiella littoralis]
MGCLCGEDSVAFPVTDGTSRCRDREGGCWSLYLGGEDVLPCVWIRCWVSTDAWKDEAAILKPVFLVVVHRIPKWVRSLCSTLLGPAFSSDYAADGPTSPKPQSRHHPDASVAHRSSSHGGGSNTGVGLVGNSHASEGETGSGLEADEVARQSGSSPHEMGVDDSNSSHSRGEDVVMGAGSFAVGSTSISQGQVGRTRRATQVSARDAERRRSAPPSVGGAAPAAARTRSSSTEGVAMRDGRKRRSAGDARPEPSRRVSRRGPVPACGTGACGDTADWSNPCQSCGNVSHIGKYLCSACHRPTRVNGSGKATWRHFNEADLNEVDLWWPQVRPDVRTSLRGDYEPRKQCVCSSSDCVAAAYDRFKKSTARNETRKCETCGTCSTPQWRKAGTRYGYMHSFFDSGKGATHRHHYLRSTKGELTMESDVCNSCLLFFRVNSESGHGVGAKLEEGRSML